MTNTKDKRKALNPRRFENGNLEFDICLGFEVWDLSFAVPEELKLCAV
jgi:hypothetical protein